MTQTRFAYEIISDYIESLDNGYGYRSIKLNDKIVKRYKSYLSWSLSFSQACRQLYLIIHFYYCKTNWYFYLLWPLCKWLVINESGKEMNGKIYKMQGCKVHLQNGNVRFYNIRFIGIAFFGRNKKFGIVFNQKRTCKKIEEVIELLLNVLPPLCQRIMIDMTLFCQNVFVKK